MATGESPPGAAGEHALFEWEPAPASSSSSPRGELRGGQRSGEPTPAQVRTAEAVEAGAIATVVIDSPLPHLDQPFDYLIPERLRGVVQAGSRVRVPFAGALVSAVVTSVGTGSGYAGTLAAVKSASAIPVVSPPGIALAAAVARRYAGSLWDVLRLMVPPRVASVERRDGDLPTPGDQDVYAAALDLAVGGGEARETLDLPPGRATVWQAIPDPERRSVPASALVAAALEATQDGSSAILVVPDARAVGAVLDQAGRWGLRRWTARSGGQVAVLDHDDGDAVRFGSYLAALHGRARIVVGTRPAVLQPVPRLGLLAVWDEGSGGYVDPHAPYPHARTVAAMRVASGARVLLGGYALSPEAAALVDGGWAHAVVPAAAQARRSAPAMDVVTAARRDEEGGAGWHWMPGSVWRRLRAAVERGPVGVVVPRAGYVRAAACARCDAWAQCRECDALLTVPAYGTDPVCVDAGHVQRDWHCPECHGDALKHVRQGADRIGEQLARMLGDVPLTVSTAAAGVVADGEVQTGAVLATPGALPAVPGGYAHLVIVDAAVAAAPGLGGELTAVRWWVSAAALARSRDLGGMVSLVGDLPPRAERALATWTPWDAALEEARERRELDLPPHTRHVALTGDRPLVRRAAAAARAAAQRDGLREIETEGGLSLLVPRSAAEPVVAALRALQRDASRAGDVLRVRVDGPLDLPR